MDITKKNIRSPDDLKIMVVSTPKTGNTWVKHLLSSVYDLSIVNVGPMFNPKELDALGARWITHQHYPAQTDLIEWGKHNNVVFVTTIRHPGDVLISLFHYIRNYGDRSVFAGHPPRIMAQDGDVIGEHTVSYLKAENGFFAYLGISLNWMRSGESLLVRYEDLWRDPITTLQDLTASIWEVSPDCIERAVDMCDIDVLRVVYGDGPKFFRQGGVGGWKQVLPQQVIDTLHNTDPYPAQFAALGYTLESDDPLTTLPRKWVSRNPFRNITHFDNGVPVPEIAAVLYSSLDLTLRGRWSRREQTTTLGSFYAWLNAPTDKIPWRQGQVPIVTNLAYYIHSERPDLQAAFPDLLGEDRHRFAHWFVTHAPDDYALDEAFIEPMRDDVEVVSPALDQESSGVRSLVSSLYRKLLALCRLVR